MTFLALTYATVNFFRQVVAEVYTYLVAFNFEENLVLLHRKKVPAVPPHVFF